MQGILLLIVMTVGPDPIMEPPTWTAAMCFTGRKQWYRQPRHYFSECSQEKIDHKAWCEPFKTRFALRSTSKPTKEGCLDVVRQNYPNLWRFRNRKVQPIICDFNIEGPLPVECDKRTSPP